MTNQEESIFVLRSFNCVSVVQRWWWCTVRGDSPMPSSGTVFGLNPTPLWFFWWRVVCHRKKEFALCPSRKAS